MSETMTIHRSAGVLAGLSACMLLGSMGTSIANIALPPLAQAFATSVQGVRWVVIAYLATLTLGSVFAGRIGDRIGRKRGLVAGLGIFVVGSGLCALAPGLLALVAARALQGAGAAFLITLTMASVRDALPRDRVGSAMGLLGTMSACGTALGPSVGGLLIGMAGWRATFAVLAPLGCVALGLVLLWLPSRPAPDGQATARIDLGGALGARLGANMAVAALMMATLIVGPFYLGRGLGLTPQAVGLIMAAGPVISIFGGVPSGRLVDRRGAGAVARAGLWALILGALTLAWLPRDWGAAGYLGAIVILTPGYQLFQSANNTQVLADAPDHMRGALSGYLGLSRNLGLITGAWALGAVFALGIGAPDFNTAAPDHITRGLHLTFAICAALMILALVLTRRADAPGNSPAGSKS
ncbi:Efflux protein A [Marinibacterium anthonyi]|nr:Efflux protein A [Marinibacterium anthonyi]